MAKAFIEIVDEGNDLVYTFDDPEDVEIALSEVDGDAGELYSVEWVNSRPLTEKDWYGNN